jgi:hypothetical protein
VSSAGSSLLAVVGLCLLVAFSAAGVIDLFWPPPPSAIKATEAAYLCLEGVILMTLTNCIAFFLGMLATADLHQGIRVWDAIFKVLSDGATLLKGGGKPGNGS